MGAEDNRGIHATPFRAWCPLLVRSSGCRYERWSYGLSTTSRGVHCLSTRCPGLAWVVAAPLVITLGRQGAITLPVARLPTGGADVDLRVRC